MLGRGAQWMSTITPQQAPDVQQLAVDTERTILERPSTIVLIRDSGDGNFTLPPQTVRLEVVQNIRSNVELRDAMVAVTRQYVVIIGFKDHPLFNNTDMRRADLFFYQDRQWEVIEIITTIPGRFLATADLTP